MYNEYNSVSYCREWPLIFNVSFFLPDFYMTVNNYWILNARHINLTTLSVAGGFRDYQVRSGLTFLPKLSHHTSALSVVVIFFKDSTEIVAW